MNLREYIEKLNRIAEEHPELLDKELCYSCDDEGNFFDRLSISPSVGYFEDNEFTNESSEDWDDEWHEINTVCVN